MQFRSHKEEILEVAGRQGITIRKNQGQCFLINEQVANFIIEKATLDRNNDNILEIGPGFGSLTEKLVNNANNVCAIELDHKLSLYLLEKFKDSKNFRLLNQDALKTVFPEHTKLISNVPYHISGPLILTYPAF